MTELFGTDGIRGKSDQPPFDDFGLYSLGKAIGKALPAKSRKILIGRDTRESGPRILKMLSKGLSSAGFIIHDAGVIPTPAISFLLASGENYDTGIVISASHNPFNDNGIKLFDPSGVKMNSSIENQISEYYSRQEGDETISNNMPAINISTEAFKKYTTRLVEHFRGSIPEKIGKAVIDCANGATYKTAPEILSPFLKEMIVTFNNPDGTNINYQCGSTHLSKLKEKVLEEGADIGIAFDGDGDRALFIDNNGNEVDGDHILTLVPLHEKKKGNLKKQIVVSTIMANFGLEKLLIDNDFEFHRTAVGDKHVWQKMLETGAPIGGEQSGHIIFSDLTVTGDGILTALKILEVLSNSSESLAEHASRLIKLPQVLHNIQVKQKIPLNNLPKFKEAEKQIITKLGGQGRVVNRYSGTENLLRIMIEGTNEEEILTYAKELGNIAISEIEKGD